jgi:hypothetical protein
MNECYIWVCIMALALGIPANDMFGIGPTATQC